MTRALKCAALLLTLSGADRIEAHTASTGFLQLTVDGQHAEGSLELAIRDVELAVGTDTDGNSSVTWGELRAAQASLQRYVAEHLSLSMGGSRCGMDFRPLEVSDRLDATYAWLPFTVECPTPGRSITIDYRLLNDFDPLHRGLLTLRAGSVAQTAVLGGEQTNRIVPLARADRWQTFVDYAESGVLHIWEGVDHLLFLITLLLPAVLVRRGREWTAAPAGTYAFTNIIKVVTAFTLAHSITLTAAALDVVRLPTRLVEAAIALSIIVAAFSNLFPRGTDRRWQIAFAFGLLHGFGFASVLAEMGLPEGARLVSLIAFNVGVELGQLAVVAVTMPLAYLARPTRAYKRVIMPWGSAAMAAVAAVWFVERLIM